MVEVRATPRLGISINFDINEQEARALDALSGYGDDAFIKAFKEKLGEAYLRDHENGLRSFLRSIREVVKEGLVTLDKSRQLFREYEEEIRKQRAEKVKPCPTVNAEDSSSSGEARSEGTKAVS